MCCECLHRAPSTETERRAYTPTPYTLHPTPTPYTLRLTLDAATLSLRLPAAIAVIQL